MICRVGMKVFTSGHPFRHFILLNHAVRRFKEMILSEASGFFSSGRTNCNHQHSGEQAFFYQSLAI
jgi:hypothetical protein